jgi:tetratricopeptide (TPR) repeat protein
MHRRRRPHAAAAALIDWAIDGLGSDLDADELAMFVDMRDQLSAGAEVPDKFLVLGYKALGQRAASTGRSALAVRLYEAALALDPGDASFHYDLGNHLSHVGRRDDAIAAYGRAVALDPGFAWALYNRGRLLYDAERVDEAFEDFGRAARAECDAAGFHGSVAKRFIRERGFQAFVDWIGSSSLPPEQVLKMYQALAEWILRAGAYGGWYLVSPVSTSGDLSETASTLALRALLADILRESPCDHMVGGLHMSRSPDGYSAVEVSADDLVQGLWYRPPAWGIGGPRPDRVAHLERLRDVIAMAEQSGALEPAWAAHYMSGAIALSALLGGRDDWPTPVSRLAVDCQISAEGRLTPVAESVAQIDSWVQAQPFRNRGGGAAPERLSRFAMDHFRAAADAQIALRMRRDEPRPTKAWLIADDGSPLMKEEEWVTGSPAHDLAAEIWSSAEPVFREWVTTAALRQDAAEHLAAAAQARRFNALAATELWGDLAPNTWRSCRERIARAYGHEVAAPKLRARLGSGGTLLDYYVHEVVEDTIVRLALSAGRDQVDELPLDTIAGELAVLLQAHRPGEMPPEGLTGDVDELLFRGVSAEILAAACLVIVPFGYLRNVPFHALATVRNAIDHGSLRAIAYLPSVAPVGSLGARPSARDSRILFVAFDASGDIDIDGELSIVRSAFPGATVIRDRDATLDRVLAALAEHELVHFACHGDVDPGIRAGYLELADARLYPWHLLTGRPSPETVLLNACLTGSTKMFEPTSDEAFGLHAAFLVAGARHVIGGLWEINEWSAQHFARAFYEAWRRDDRASPAAAVVDAQGKLRSETADPFLWAPHAFFGDWH